MNTSNKTSLRLLSLTIFMLVGFPKFRIMVGPAPLYIIDILLFLTWIKSNHLHYPYHSTLRPLVALILVAATFSELAAGLQLGTLFQPTYMIGRTLLAGSLFFSARRIIQRKQDLEPVLKAATLGALITAALMVMTSLPPTRQFVTRNIFSLPFLEPSSNEVLSRYGFRTLEFSMRGRSLVGISNISGAFLNTFLPLIFLLTAYYIGVRWKFLLYIAMVLIPTGVIMSYSRGATAGLILLVIIVLFLNSSRVRRPILLGIGAMILGFYWVGWNSSYFYFQRLENATQTMLANPLAQSTNRERFLSYVEPFQHLVKHPQFLLLGQGFARWSINGNFLWEGADAANHSVFADGYYGYGMLAALAYVLLLFLTIRDTWKFARTSAQEFPGMFSRALLASLAGFSIWFLSALGGVHRPHGAMLLFFVFALADVQRSLHQDRESVQA